jgi:hypothetical protein
VRFVVITMTIALCAAQRGEAQQPGQDGGEAARPRYIDRGPYVEDTQTKLLWQKDGAASGKKNFYEAAEYAKKLELGGIKGWRVPTADELRTIFPAAEAPFTNSGYTTEQCCGGGIEFRSYWTCELDLGVDDYAYVFHWYANGGKNNCYASRNFVQVRCVHDPISRLAGADVEVKAEAVKVRELIAQLGDPAFDKRQQAMDELVKIAAPLGSLLREAEKNATDAEVRYRLQQVLRRRGE